MPDAVLVSALMRCTSTRSRSGARALIDLSAVVYVPNQVSACLFFNFTNWESGSVSEGLLTGEVITGALYWVKGVASIPFWKKYEILK